VSDRRGRIVSDKCSNMCFYVHDVFPFQSWSVIYRDRSITINVMDVDYSRRNYRANKTRLDVQIFRSLFNEFRKTRVQLQVPARELCALQPFLTDRIASYRVYNNQRRVCLFVFSLSTFPLSALKRKIISALPRSAYNIIIVFRQIYLQTMIDSWVLSH